MPLVEHQILPSRLASICNKRQKVVLLSLLKSRWVLMKVSKQSWKCLSSHHTLHPFVNNSYTSFTNHHLVIIVYSFVHLDLFRNMNSIHFFILGLSPSGVSYSLSPQMFKEGLVTRNALCIYYPPTFRSPYLKYFNHQASFKNNMARLQSSCQLSLICNVYF